MPPGDIKYSISTLINPKRDVSGPFSTRRHKIFDPDVYQSETRYLRTRRHKILDPDVYQSETRCPGHVATRRHKILDLDAYQYETRRLRTRCHKETQNTLSRRFPKPSLKSKRLKIKTRGTLICAVQFAQKQNLHIFELISKYCNTVLIKQ